MEPLLKLSQNYVVYAAELMWKVQPRVEHKSEHRGDVVFSCGAVISMWARLKFDSETTVGKRHADKVALGQVFSEYFGFPSQSLFHLFLHNHHHLSSAQIKKRSHAGQRQGCSCLISTNNRKKMCHNNLLLNNFTF
jgi:hypothetical protein